MFMMNKEHIDPTREAILVVDDTPENLHLLMGILAEHGYDVRLAPDGLLALKFARAAPPDLILLDIKMPGMDGYEVCEQLKADPRTQDIPVIFISALEEVFNKVKAFSYGGIDYITKPFQAEEVLARVKTHLTLQNLQKQLQENNRRLQEQNTRRQQAEHALQQANATLEERVAARTAELEAEIIERKRVEKELQKSSSEIQRLKDQLQAENIYLREEIRLEHNFEEIIGRNQLLKYMLFKVEQVAPTDTTVLILGETGTGKELIARAIHHASFRKKRSLVKINCAALPAHLIESELFGHEKGAFTGAHARQIGRFELANGGTIFLDEIGELSLELQAKLLRVLQDGEFERLGNPKTMTVDTRVIAATNRMLEAEVQAGRFRQDLYYRLNVYPLSVPPLRERPDDIPLLVQAFVQRFNKKLGKEIVTIPRTTIHALQQYPWPGNIRELENVIERAVITSQDRTLRIELPKLKLSLTAKTKQLDEVERNHILQILEETNWKISGDNGAATILGLPPSTLRSRMQKLGIKRP